MNNLKKIFRFFFVTSFLFYFNNLEAQKSLDKKEIFDNWVSAEAVINLSRHDGLSKILRFDTILNNRIYNELNWLQQLRVDTIGFFISTSPGYSNKDTCMNIPYPSKIYIFWQSKGEYFLKRLSTKCDYGYRRIDTLASIFRYYSENLEQINEEYIMPVIYKGEITSDGKFVYSGSTSFHDPHFTIYCQLKDNVKYLNFSEYSYTNKGSIFYKDNIMSKSYYWFSKFISLIPKIN